MTTTIETVCDHCEEAGTDDHPTTVYRIGLGGERGRMTLRKTDLHEECVGQADIKNLLKVGRSVDG